MNDTRLKPDDPRLTSSITMRGHEIMHDYGYTGSACIPMAFNDAWEKGLVKPGELLFFIGSGGGLAFAAAAFRM